MTDFCALVGDIGGTHARLAFAEFSGNKPVISHIKVFASGQYASGGTIVRDYLAQTPLKRIPDVAVIAVAGPVADGAVYFTNLGWSFSENELREQGISAVRFLNDFEAFAISIQHLVPSDLHRIGPRANGDPRATVGALGPGTGFGASALVRNGEKWAAIAAEGGHASFAAVDDVEREVARLLARKFPHVSIERIVSGSGLQNLHAALNEIEGVAADAQSPTEITERALIGEAPYARTVLRFCTILGSVAGDFALIYGARGGMFIGGGIAPTILPLLEKSDFRTRFEAKGRFKDYLAAIPTYVVLNPYVAFLGAAEIAHQLKA